MANLETLTTKKAALVAKLRKANEKIETLHAALVEIERRIVDAAPKG